VSAKAVHCTAVQVDDSIPAFLLMAETAVTSGVFVVGSGADDDHPRIVVAATTPRTTMMTMSWLGSWWGPNDRNNVMALVIDGSTFWFGLLPLLISSQRGGALLAVLGIVYAEKKLQSLDFRDPFQAQRLPIVSAKSDLVSCHCCPWAAKKIRVATEKKLWTKNFRPGPHTVPIWDKSV
jgi:hypothetical protein